MAKGFEWRGVDGAGFQYGFFHEGGKAYRLDIAIPGAGFQTQDAKTHTLYVQGEEVGTAPSVGDGRAFLERFCNKGLHRNLGRVERGARRSLTETLRSMVEPFTGNKRGGR